MTASSTAYNTLHQWNLRHWVKSGICEMCGHDRKTQWSNRTGRYIKGDKKDWQELCPQCHYLYDTVMFNNYGNRGNRTTRKMFTDQQEKAIYKELRDNNAWGMKLADKLAEQYGVSKSLIYLTLKRQST